MKKGLLMIALAVLCMLLAPQAASAATSGDYEYTVNESGWAIITEYIGTASTVEVPEEIDGYAVDSIADQAFANKTFITSPVRIPLGVSVESGTFSGSPCGWVYYGESSDGFLYEINNGITITGYTKTGGSLDIPGKINNHSVTTIAEGAFEGRTDLTALDIPSSVSVIKANAFKGCSNLTGDFSFVSQLTEIGDYAFYGCGKLTGEANIETDNWGEHSFQNCTGLTSYTNPNDFVPAYAFAGCTGLAQMVYATPSTYATDTDITASGYYSIGAHAFDGAGVTQLICNTGSNYNYYLGNTIEIGAYAFANTTLSQVYLCINFPEIAAHAFDGCFVSGTMTIQAEGSYTLDADSFYGASINKLDITADFLTVEEDAFEGCTFSSLQLNASELIHDPSFDNHNIIINSNAFPYGNYGAVSIQCSSIEIYSSALEGAGFSNLSITTNRYGANIEDYAFKNCTVLDKMSLTAYGGYITIGEGCFQNAGAANGLSITQLNGIPDYAFQNFTGNITITDSSTIESIGQYAFAGCTDFTGMDLSTVTSIGAHAFEGCTSIPSLTLSEFLTSLGEYAFSGCTGMAGDLTIPTGLQGIQEYTFYHCGLDGTLSFPEGLTSVAPHAFEKSGFTDVSFPQTLRSLGESAFEDCDGLTSITLPKRTGGSFIASDSETGRTFADCSNLITVTLSSGITRIGEGTFEDCPSLTTVSLPDSVKSIGKNAFSDCTALPGLTTSAESIGENAFSNDSDLTELRLKASGCVLDPTSLTGATNAVVYSGSGHAAENYCIANQIPFIDPDFTYTINQGNASVTGYTGTLTEVILPRYIELNPVTALADDAFYGNATVTSILLPETLQSIGEKAIGGCPKLPELAIPSNVSSIHADAFKDCNPALTIIVQCHSYAQQWAKQNSFPYNARNHTIRIIPGAPAECEKTGLTDGEECAVCGDIITAQTVIPVTGHDWNDPVYAWNADNTEVTGSRVCRHDATHVETETAQASGQKTKDETCTDKGETTYTSDPFVSAAFTAQTKTEADIPALGHDWDDPTYTWNADNTEVTAARVCKRDNGHSETETVAAAGQITKAATCEQKGETTYTSQAFANTAFAVQTRKEEISAIGHDWGDPTYTWNADNTEVTAVRVCGHDATHIETETATAAGTVTTAPTCESKGKTTYTGDPFTNAAFTVQEKTEEDIDALGHDWDSVSYAWNADNTALTASRACKRDNSHIETESVSVSATVTKPATCEEKGETTYISADFQNAEFKKQTKVLEDIDALGHEWGDAEYLWTGDKVTATRTCKNDKKHAETETVSSILIVSVSPTETGAGEKKRVSDDFKNTAFVKQETAAGAIPALETLNKPLFPSNMQTIEEEAFEGTKFQAILIPETCTSIGKRAFANCAELVYIRIPSSVASIAPDAFEDCPNAVIDQQ